MSATIGRAAIETWLRAFADEVALQRGYLTELDAAIGDADHGVNMDRGMQAVVGKLDTAAADDVGTLLKLVGMTLVSTVGGAAGPLYGTLFLTMGTAADGAVELTAESWAAALAVGVSGVQTRGKASRGDKTMLDALLPAVEALRQGVASGSRLTDALQRAAQAAHEGMKATIPLVARKGRASYLGERSAGHQDPGATSSWLLLKTAAEHLSGAAAGDQEEAGGPRQTAKRETTAETASAAQHGSTAEAESTAGPESIAGP